MHAAWEQGAAWPTGTPPAASQQRGAGVALLWYLRQFLWSFHFCAWHARRCWLRVRMLGMARHTGAAAAVLGSSRVGGQLRLGVEWGTHQVHAQPWLVRPLYARTKTAMLRGGERRTIVSMPHVCVALCGCRLWLWSTGAHAHEGVQRAAVHAPPEFSSCSSLPSSFCH
jgi:hypothetical protein